MHSRDWVKWPWKSSPVSHYIIPSNYYLDLTFSTTFFSVFSSNLPKLQIFLLKFCISSMEISTFFPPKFFYSEIICACYRKNLLFCSCTADQIKGKDFVFLSLKGENETWQGGSLCAICCPMENLPHLLSRFWDSQKNNEKKAGWLMSSRNLLEVGSQVSR